jgi:uncharacterized Fe-S cluster-containing radical SAM superfamily protein
MNQLFKQMESAFEEKIQDGVNKLQSGDLKSVASISRKIQSQEEKLERLIEETKQAKKDLLALTDQELPALMQEIGLSKVELSDDEFPTELFGAFIGQRAKIEKGSK